MSSIDSSDQSCVFGHDCTIIVDGNTDPSLDDRWMSMGVCTLLMKYNLPLLRATRWIAICHLLSRYRDHSGVFPIAECTFTRLLESDLLTVVPVFQHHTDPTRRLGQDIENSSIQVRQAILPVRFSSIQDDHGCTRAWLVMTRTDPVSLAECPISGVVKVIEWLGECIHRERRSRSQRKRGRCRCGHRRCRIRVILDK